MNKLRCFLVLFVWVATTLSAQESSPPVTAMGLVREGVELHDAGRFEEAIERYRQALAIEADNAVVLYELGHTYLTTGRFAECLVVGRIGLKKPGRVEAELWTMVGNCHSSAGELREALRAFENGLANFPDDPSLNFNVAVTLTKLGLIKNAREHFEKVVAVKPTYASPFLHLGGLAAEQGRHGEALFWLLRFLSLEQDTERSANASKLVFVHLMSGVEDQGEGNIALKVDLGTPGEAESRSPLELFRSLAGATAHLEDAPSKSPAERQVAALVNFVRMAAEAPANPSPPEETFWLRVVGPVVQLEKKGLLECFGHILAARAGLEGAAAWLEKHPQKQENLATALSQLEP